MEEIMYASILRFFALFLFFNKRQDSSETFKLLEFRPRQNGEEIENLKKLSFHKF